MIYPGTTMLDFSDQLHGTPQKQSESYDRQKSGTPFQFQKLSYKKGNRPNRQKIEKTR
jgi:hypothetical protein